MPVAQKDAAGLIVPALRMRVDQPLQLVMQGLIVTGAFLIQNDQVRAEAAHAPVGVRQEQLADQR